MLEQRWTVTAIEEMSLAALALCIEFGTFHKQVITLPQTLPSLDHTENQHFDSEKPKILTYFDLEINILSQKTNILIHLDYENQNFN